MPASFYEQRHLPEPDRELRPESAARLCEVLDELDVEKDSWRLVGDGQHIRTEEFGPATTVVRTEEIDGVLEFETESGVIRVGAGTRWKELITAVADGGFSMQRYGLHPPTATIGGLLGRRRRSPELLRGGDLLDGCVSVGAHHPGQGDYRYLVAPRKASGPDLRYDFVGAEGAGGAILDASFVVWPPVESRLVRYEKISPADAARILGEVFETMMTPTWVHYGSTNGVLQFGLAAPGRLLRSRMNAIADRAGAPDITGDTEDARSRKQWLEARHPDRRSAPEAESTRVFLVVPSALTDDVAEMFGPGVVDVEIPAWTPHRATAFVRYEDEKQCQKGADAPPEKSCWATWPLVA